jgi:hypothetical protein
MKGIKIIDLGLLSAAICLATTAPPFAPEMAVVDRMVHAANFAKGSDSALSLLERVAEGRSGEIDEVTANKVGLKLADVQDPYLKDSSVRAYAVRRIGDVELPGALDYLSALKRTELGPDDSGQIWPAAILGLNTARLRAISSSAAKVEFLESLLQRGGITAWWAANELCDSGSGKSLSLIRDSVIRRNSSQRGEDEIRFCEKRIQVLARDPDRVKALVSVLSTNNGSLEDQKLQLWAVRHLAALHNAEADQALARYMVEVGKVLAQSSEGQRLYVVGEEIRSLMLVRSREQK